MKSKSTTAADRPMALVIRVKPITIQLKIRNRLGPVASCDPNFADASADAKPTRLDGMGANYFV
jgi:hypothetical protein